MYDHWMLAQFRNRRFAVRPDATARPEDTLKALIDAWCQRCATSITIRSSSDERRSVPNSGPCNSVHCSSEPYAIPRRWSVVRRRVCCTRQLLRWTNV